MYKVFIVFILAKTEGERPFGSHVFNLVYLICFIFHSQFCNLQCKLFDRFSYRIIDAQAAKAVLLWREEELHAKLLLK